MILGAWMLLSGAYLLIRANKSMTWPTADARILDSSIAYRPDGDGGRIPYLSLEYVFTVNGKAYSGDTVMFSGHDYSTFSDMKETVNKYPRDKAVRVRYLPTDPDVSVLEPGIHPKALLYPASGLFFIAAAIGLPILLRRVMNQFHVGSPNKPIAPKPATASPSKANQEGLGNEIAQQ